MASSPSLYTTFLIVLLTLLSQLHSGFSDTVFVDYSPERGYYLSPISVKLTPPAGFDTVRYTLCATDSQYSSVPSRTAGTVYSAPISVSSTVIIQSLGINATSGLITNLTTHSYIFPGDVINQAKMQRTITQQAQYSSQFTNALLKIPTFSFRSSQMMFASLAGTAVIASVEYISSDPKVKNWTRTVGAYDTGQLSLTYQKKSIRFQVDDPYTTEDSVDEPMFVGYDWGISSAGIAYRVFSLRSGSQDSIMGANSQYNFYNTEVPTYMKNIWHDWTFEDLGYYSAHARLVHAFWNGEYCGLYHFRGAPANLLDNYYGAENTDYQNTPNGSPSTPVWNQIIAASNNWNNFQTWIQVNNFMDYMLIFHYGANADTGTSHNWQSMGPAYKKPFLGPLDAGWKFWHSDEDFTFPPWANRVNANMLSGQTASGVWTGLWSEKNPDFIQLFADRVFKLYKSPNGALTVDGVLNRFQRIKDMHGLNISLIPETARWCNLWAGPNPGAYSIAQWDSDVNMVMNNFVKARTNIVLGQYAALSPNPVALNGPSFSLADNTTVSPGTAITVTVTAPCTTVVYTTNGLDPRLSGGAIESTATSSGTTSAQLTLTTTTTIMARCRTASAWGPIDSVLIRVNTPTCELCGSIVITEVHYHPYDPKGSKPLISSFIEIKNIGPNPVNLNGAYFTNIQFQFPPVILAPNNFYVITRSWQDFLNASSGVQPNSRYFGTLDFGKDVIQLNDAVGRPVVSVSYEDAAPWSEMADGQGYTLVPRGDYSSLLTSSSAINWRTSTNKFGSPGSDDPPVPDARKITLIINEIASAMPSSKDEWVEFYNPTNSPVNLYRWVITNGYENPAKHARIKNTMTVPANGYLTVSSSTTFRFKDSGDSIFAFGTMCCDTDGVTPVIDAEYISRSFSASLPNITLGLFKLSTGETIFDLLASPTKEAANAGPYIAPVVIAGVQYDQSQSGLYSNMQYIKLTCIDTATSIQNWTIQVNSNPMLVFDNIMLSPKQNLYIINSTTTKTDFQAAYGFQWTDPQAPVISAFIADTLWTTITLYQNVPDQNYTVKVDSVNVSAFAPQLKRAAMAMPSQLQRNLATPGYAGDPASWSVQLLPPPPAPIDCKWTDWDEWSACGTCAITNSSRSRTIQIQAQYGGQDCTGPNFETFVCPCPIDCQWTNWTEWSPCNSTCGITNSTRERTIEIVAQYGGLDCAGPDVESVVCECPPSALEILAHLPIWQLSLIGVGGFILLALIVVIIVVIVHKKKKTWDVVLEDTYHRI